MQRTNTTRNVSRFKEWFSRWLETLLFLFGTALVVVGIYLVWSFSIAIMATGIVVIIISVMIAKAKGGE
ncbi:hypothetical protein [Limosilactobacillus allomucosae]|uniref:DUF1056 family protein n=1 Tax=Limosilactobacillus allomucosae TaxID=3142938 RepID=A0ABV0I2N7_9LACO